MNAQHTHRFSILRTTVAVSVILLVAIAAMANSLVRASGEEAPHGTFRMGAITADCTFQTGGPLYGCTPWAGVVVTFVVEDSTGTHTETCTTVDPGSPDARAASCGIEVEFGSTVTASIDPAVIPAGYILNQDATQVWTAPDGPPDGVTGQPIFTLTAVDGGSGEEVQPTEDAQPTEVVQGSEPTAEPQADFVHHHRARIVSGSCAGLGNVVADLSAVAPSVGAQVGQASAVEAETSNSTIAIGLDGIIDGPSAVVVYGGDGNDSVVLACGDVGGVNDRDGELVVALWPVNGSGAVGMARLAYNPADASMTDITIYLAPLP